jgi:hypothetical protein
VFKYLETFYNPVRLHQTLNSLVGAREHFVTIGEERP